MPVLSTPGTVDPPPSPHADFLPLQPLVERHARSAFRHVGPEAREEATAEVVAAAFIAHVALKASGRHAAAFPMRLARYSVLRVRGGRPVGGRRNSCDVLSRRAQYRHGFRVVPLSGPNPDWAEAFVADDTPIPDQVAFRIDVPAFLATLSDRDRQMVHSLAEGHAAWKVARQAGVSPGRLSQLRREWHRQWLAFHDTEAKQPGREPSTPVCA